jgi:hypothetical protein
LKGDPFPKWNGLIGTFQGVLSMNEDLI